MKTICFVFLASLILASQSCFSLNSNDKNINSPSTKVSSTSNLPAAYSDAQVIETFNTVTAGATEILADQFKDLILKNLIPVRGQIQTGLRDSDNAMKHTDKKYLSYDCVTKGDKLIKIITLKTDGLITYELTGEKILINSKNQSKENPCGIPADPDKDFGYSIIKRNFFNDLVGRSSHYTPSSSEYFHYYLNNSDLIYVRLTSAGDFSASPVVPGSHNFIEYTVFHLKNNTLVNSDYRYLFKENSLFENNEVYEKNDRTITSETSYGNNLEPYREILRNIRLIDITGREYADKIGDFSYLID